jgi:iron complex outermembrane receptor protein
VIDNEKKSRSNERGLGKRGGIMTKRALRLSTSAGVLAAVLALGGAAHAADATADQAVATATTVAPLTITAERRTINLQTAPVAASVIPGSQLQNEGIESLDDLQFHTPSLTVADFGQGNLFNIRGVGKDLTNVQTPSGVVTYWDGIASFPGFFADAPYFDIANVEVLRGPQGTFAGQNATGGAVFITTNDARLGSFSGDIEGQYGNYNDGLLRGFVNVPIGDKLALRIAFNGERRDSFYTVAGPWTTPFHGTPGRQLLGSVRLGVTWQPTDALKIVFKADVNYLDHGGFIGSPTLATPSQLNPADIFHVNSFINDYATNKGYTLTLNAAYTLPDGIILRSITGWQAGLGNANIDLTELFPTASFEDYGREQIASEELNVVSPDNKGPLSWVGGLYYQHDYVSLLPGGGAPGFDIGLPHGGLDLELNYRTPKTTEAVFGQASYDITPALQLQVGARYTHETFGLTDDSPLLVGGVQVLDPVAVGHTSDSGPTGKVALTWKVDDANTLYAFVATGRKAAGINTTPAGIQTAPAAFSPESVTDIEAGWKPIFFDGHLRAQFGGYYSLYKNFQLSFATPNAPTMSFIRNLSGTTTLYGLEAEAQAVFGPWSFNASASYEHSSLGAAQVTDPVSGQPIQLGGRTAPLAPTWTVSVGAQYAIALGNGGTLTPRVDVSYLDSQWATPYQDFGDFLPSRTLLNAEIAYAQGPYRLTAFATNAFNLHYIIATNIGLRYAGNPGQYGIRAERRF